MMLNTRRKSKLSDKQKAELRHLGLMEATASGESAYRPLRARSAASLHRRGLAYRTVDKRRYRLNLDGLRALAEHSSTGLQVWAQRRVEYLSGKEPDNG